DRKAVGGLAAFGSQFRVQERPVPLNRFFAVALMLTFVPAATAQAQIRSEPPLVQDGGQLVLEAMEQRMVLPMPDWLNDAQRNDANVREHLEATYIADETQALLELYPK